MDGISSYNSFIAVHKPQLVLSGVPEHFWPSLCKKLKDQIFDSGLSFSLVQIDYEGEERMPYDPIWSVLAIRNISRMDPTNIYLVDHAWTFKPTTVRSSLRNVPGLLERMCALLQIPDDISSDDKIQKVYDNIWKFAHTYAIAGDFSVEERVPVWYILDELGSGIPHSDTPNFRAVPFIYVPQQITFTILFPIENVEEGETITRNYVEGNYSDSQQRDAMMIPWRHYEYFYEPYTQEEPNTTYFIEGHIVESLPTLNLLPTERNVSRCLKVFSEYRYINDHLTSNDFEIVHDEDEADILWYLNHFKNFKELSEISPTKFINQFPFEYVITVKDLLAIISRRSKQEGSVSTNSMETFPPWLPTTFNLKTELPKLVSYYMQRKKAGLDNYWICKPYNLARGLDMHITNNLDFLCRLPLTGPKIAQKYIENPVLFERPEVGLVKFDIRYVILLTSVQPTEVHIYKNFFLRFSNKPFAMTNFDDYEQHFTVMNYNEDAPLYRLMTHEFKEAWDEQYQNYPWAEVEENIFKMFRELFTSATMKEPPCGIAKNPQSRALYAADLMLSWENNGKYIQPKLLEVNWMPDCQRACTYYPDFYNDVFSVMFLNKSVESCVKIL